MNLIEAAKNRNYGTLRKLENYFREYDFCFRDLRDKNVRILEIGVQGGVTFNVERIFPARRSYRGG